MEEIKTAEGGSLIKIPIEDEVKQAYIDYSMSVIVQRALPDVRDGLKPFTAELCTQWIHFILQAVEKQKNVPLLSVKF